MKTITEIKISVKRFSLFMILTISELSMRAGAASKYKNLITKEFGSFEGIYIMGGLIIVGLGIYAISNHYSKKNEKLEKSKPAPTPNTQTAQRRAQRRVIRKTS